MQSTLPVTRKQMKLPMKDISLSTILIYDGKIQKDNLKNLGFDMYKNSCKFIKIVMTHCTKVHCIICHLSYHVFYFFC